jgi:ubiquinone/menaquinone biosynthesis C-methylase UbiE
MGRFATTVPYYERFRQAYPREFFGRLASMLRLDGTQDLVDLGCGPAMLALGISDRVKSVVGVDPEPAMIEAARTAAARAGVPLALHECRVEDLPAGAGPFDVALIGRALHWMEPKATAAVLERILTPRGVIVVCRALSAEGLNPWLPAYDLLKRSLRAPDDAVDYRTDPAVFFSGSRFIPRESFLVMEETAISADDLAGRLLSMSNTSRAVIGARADGVAGEVLSAVAPFIRPDGMLPEVVEAKATILARSG